MQIDKQNQAQRLCSGGGLRYVSIGDGFRDCSIFLDIDQQRVHELDQSAHTEAGRSVDR